MSPPKLPQARRSYTQGLRAFVLDSQKLRDSLQQTGTFQSGTSIVAVNNQALGFLEAEERRKAPRKLKEVLHATKRMTKAELRRLVAEVMKELLREEVVKYILSYDGQELLRDTIVKAFDTRDFEDMVARVMRDDMMRVKRLLEDAGINTLLTKQQQKRTKPPPAGRQVRF